MEEGESFKELKTVIDRLQYKTVVLLLTMICPMCVEHFIQQSNKLNARFRVLKQQILDQILINALSCEHFVNCGFGEFTIVECLCKCVRLDMAKSANDSIVLV